MFDTRMVGKKIAVLRKEKNMTQMELADAMGVSYQAVSNWERGNSMPDISKLPELAQIFECSVDELLGENKASKLVEQVINGNGENYVKEQKISMETVVEAAPVMKPRQTEKIVDAALESGVMSLRDLVAAAPYLDEEYMDQLIRQHVDQNWNQNSIADIVPLAPFLSDETLNYLAETLKKNGDYKGIVRLAPFLPGETVGQIVQRAISQGKIKECMGLFPFME